MRPAFMKSALMITLVGIGGGVIVAQTQPFSLNAVYSCNNGRTMLRVTGCTGTNDTDLCGVQHLNTAGTAEISPKTSEYRKSVVGTLQACQLQPKATPAQAATKAPQPQAAATPEQSSAAQHRPATPPPVQQVGADGFRVGDTVSILTGFGWVDGKVLAVRGNSYSVHAQTGVDVWKDYPAEVRRIGAPTAEDRANGIYQLHDRVQVNFEGKWIESEIVTTMAMDYQVKLPGNRIGWVTAQNLRPSTAPAPAAPKAGVPPKPGLTSCAEKIEGRYSTTSGFGSLSIVFRSGKATMGDDDIYECWMGGGKIYLHKPGGGPIPDMPLDINNDGTLDNPAGELKKKGN